MCERHSQRSNVLLRYSGDKTIIGRGAGGMETASSIIRDLIEIRESIAKNTI